MKKYSIILLSFMNNFYPSNSGSIFNMGEVNKVVSPIKKSKKKRKKHSTPKTGMSITGTVYHPECNQTDSSPLRTANGSYIDTNKLRTGELRWIGISTNMFKRNGGKFKFNDTVIISSKHKEINGKWVVKDVLPSRRNGIDFLQHKKTGFFGLYKNINISK